MVDFYFHVRRRRIRVAVVHDYAAAYGCALALLAASACGQTNLITPVTIGPKADRSVGGTLNIRAPNNVDFAQMIATSNAFTIIGKTNNNGNIVLQPGDVAGGSLAGVNVDYPRSDSAGLIVQQAFSPFDAIKFQDMVIYAVPARDTSSPLITSWELGGYPSGPEGMLRLGDGTRNHGGVDGRGHDVWCYGGTITGGLTGLCHLGNLIAQPGGTGPASWLLPGDIQARNSTGQIVGDLASVSENGSFALSNSGGTAFLQAYVDMGGGGFFTVVPVFSAGSTAAGGNAGIGVTGGATVSMDMSIGGNLVVASLGAGAPRIIQSEDTNGTLGIGPSLGITVDVAVRNSTGTAQCFLSFVQGILNNSTC